MIVLMVLTGWRNVQVVCLTVNWWYVVGGNEMGSIIYFAKKKPFDFLISKKMQIR